MSDTIKNKHVLGGLTLRDLTGKINDLRVWSVELDGQLCERFVLSANRMDLWDADHRCYDEEPADRIIDLDTPVKVRDGKVVLIDPVTGFEETMVFGRTEFVPSNISILEETRPTGNR